MKIRVFNKKVIKEKVLNRTNSKTISKFKPNSSTLPLDLYKANRKVNASIMYTINSLPPEIQLILNSGNNPITVKKNSNRITILTDTKLTIILKSDTLCDRVPQCKIIDGNNGKLVLLDTFKVTH